MAVSSCSHELLLLYEPQYICRVPLSVCSNILWWSPHYLALQQPALTYSCWG